MAAILRHHVAASSGDNTILGDQWVPRLAGETASFASHLGCLVLARLSAQLPSISAEAIADAVLSTNDSFFVRQLVRLPTLVYSQNVSSALIAGAMCTIAYTSASASSMEEEEEEEGDATTSSTTIAIQCIARFPAQDHQFAQVAQHILHTFNRHSSSSPAAAVGRAALQYLCGIPQFQVKSMCFLVSSAPTWTELGCRQELVHLVTANLECADVLGLFLLEGEKQQQPASDAAEARMMAIGALAHCQWFSIHEAHRFGKELLDHVKAPIASSSMELALWAVEQTLQHQGDVFFNPHNNGGDGGTLFAQLVTVLLALLRSSDDESERDVGAALRVLRLLLQVELNATNSSREEEESPRSSRLQRQGGSRFSFCFSQLAELLQRRMTDAAGSTTSSSSSGIIDEIASLLVMLVSISSSEVAGFVSWLMTKQVELLEARLSVVGTSQHTTGLLLRRKRALDQHDEEEDQGATTARVLGASLKVLLAAIGRLQRDEEVIPVPMVHACAALALRIWRGLVSSAGANAEETRGLAVLLMREMARLGNNGEAAAAYGQVINSEIGLGNTDARIASGLSLCFTLALDDALLVHVRQVHAQRPLLACAAARAWGEMLHERRRAWRQQQQHQHAHGGGGDAARLQQQQLEEWLPHAERDQALDLLMVYVRSADGPPYEAEALAALTSQYMSHVVATSSQSLPVAKLLQLVCLAAPVLPRAFEDKYAEWKVLFDGTCRGGGGLQATGSLVLEAMGHVMPATTAITYVNQ